MKSIRIFQVTGHWTNLHFNAFLIKDGIITIAAYRMPILFSCYPTGYRSIMQAKIFVFYNLGWMPYGMRLRKKK